MGSALAGGWWLLAAMCDVCRWGPFGAGRIIIILYFRYSTPLATLGEEAELLFSDAFHDHLTEYNLAQYTVHRPRQNSATQTERIRQRHTEWIPEAGPTQDNHKRKRPV
eukprot:scaffold20180_cov116-Isochrysis_galbana.AAC.1